MILTQTEILQHVDRLSAERLTVCVTRAWVRPRHAETGPVFDDTDLARLRLIVELTEDLAVNDDAVPLILNLIDEVSSLRRRIRHLDAALAAEAPDLCDLIVTRLRDAEGRDRP
ncbi:MAG: hypothetical protein KDA50_06875 [Rhodobacteraceae bacterium]|nr:hypothetical protein [Paracoccaceae bacterium]